MIAMQVISWVRWKAAKKYFQIYQKSLNYLKSKKLAAFVSNTKSTYMRA